jgi:hypothetical protein
METKKKSDTKKKTLVVAGALLAGGALVYAGYKIFIKDKSKNEEDNTALPSDAQASILPQPVKPKVMRNDHFPLRRGSLGNRVKILQSAIQRIIGKDAYPDSEIDGDFGPRTEAAVAKAGFPVIVTQEIFNQILSAPAKTAIQTVFNPRVISAALHTAAAAKNLAGVLAALKGIKNTQDYSQVNEFFKNAQVFSVARSIVTYMLDVAFAGDSYAKEQIKNEFRRIGLKQDAESGKWSLSGIKIAEDIITLTDTYVLDKENRKIPVKEKTILGEKINISNGMTYFKSIDGKVYAVPTARVKNV